MGGNYTLKDCDNTNRMWALSAWNVASLNWDVLWVENTHQIFEDLT